MITKDIPAVIEQLADQVQQIASNLRFIAQQSAEMDLKGLDEQLGNISSRLSTIERKLGDCDYDAVEHQLGTIAGHFHSIDKNWPPERIEDMLEKTNKIVANLAIVKRNSD